jgi:predicted DCC family thiol-disulfide oxidoreductase YuxK
MMLIIYDGACPACAAYQRHVRLQQAAGAVEWLSARSDDSRLAQYRAQGYVFDQGLLVVLDQVVYVGADAMHVLACCSSRSGLMNRLHVGLFRRRWIARMLYPILRAGRAVLLWMLRIPPIKSRQ